jgi:hypothetical protein
MSDQIQRSVLDPKYRETQEANLAQRPEKKPGWGDALDALAQFMGQANPVKGALSGGIPYKVLLEALKRVKAPATIEEATRARLLDRMERPEVREGVERTLSALPESERVTPLGMGVDYTGVKIGPEVLKFSPKMNTTWEQVERSRLLPPEVFAPLKNAERFPTSENAGVTMLHQPYLTPPSRANMYGPQRHEFQGQLEAYFDELLQGTPFRGWDVRPENVGRLDKEMDYRLFDMGSVVPRDVIEQTRAKMFPPMPPRQAPPSTDNTILWGQK